MPIRVSGVVDQAPRRFRSKYAAEIRNALDEHFTSGAEGSLLRFDSDTEDEAKEIEAVARGHIRESYPGKTAIIRKDQMDSTVRFVGFGDFKPRGRRGPNANPRKPRSKKTVESAA